MNQGMELMKKVNKNADEVYLKNERLNFKNGYYESDQKFNEDKSTKKEIIFNSIMLILCIIFVGLLETPH